MKKNWKNKFVPLLALVAALLLAACDRRADHAAHADTYTCPMHPTVVADRPGTCPVCGMDLVRQARPGEEVPITEDLGKLIASPNEKVVASVKTVKGEFTSRRASWQAQGVVTYDSRNVYTIAARVGGRLEKVFITYAFQPVRKGQKVAEIYSPEMATAQRELLYVVQNDGGNNNLIEAAKNKLYQLGATRAQVNDLIEQRAITSTFAVYSPYDGYVIRSDQQAPAVSTTAPAAEMGGGMDGVAASTPVSTPVANTPGVELLRAGNYVSAGQTLFKVVNTAALRVELDAAVAEAGHIKLNDEVDLDLGQTEAQKAKVDFVQPFFTGTQEFVKVRVYVKNKGEWQIGQLVRATLHRQPLEALWVPRDAVVDLGLRLVVFVKERGVFTPRNVVAGAQADGWTAITQGLSSADEIAANGQYLVDSESFIKTK